MPEGLLYDPELKDLSAEEVYDRIATDLRRMRRLATLRGKGVGDILGEPARLRPATTSTSTSSTAAASPRASTCTSSRHRGFLPGGLVEEIRALSHPPLPWDARLARWFDEFVPRPEPVRTYARPARRQASTPDIPRAGRYFPPEEITRCTFGVVLDTSGSMDRALLGKALGAIASYAEARDVPAARVVFCDAAPHDAGYLPADGDRRAGTGTRPRRYGPAARDRPAAPRRRLPARRARCWSSRTAGATSCGCGVSTRI